MAKILGSVAVGPIQPDVIVFATIRCLHKQQYCLKHVRDERWTCQFFIEATTTNHVAHVTCEAAKQDDLER